MTANHAHTPTTNLVRSVYVQHMTRHGDTSMKRIEDGLDRWLATVEAAAEQRGRIAELREVVAEFEHQDPNDLRNNSMRDGQVWTLESCMSAHIASAPILDWLENRADRLEGDDG